MFSITCVETLSQSFFCKMDSLQRQNLWKYIWPNCYQMETKSKINNVNFVAFSPFNHQITNTKHIKNLLQNSKQSCGSIRLDIKTKMRIFWVWRSSSFIIKGTIFHSFPFALFFCGTSIYTHISNNTKLALPREATLQLFIMPLIWEADGAHWAAYKHLIYFI